MLKNMMMKPKVAKQYPKKQKTPIPEVSEEERKSEDEVVIIRKLPRLQLNIAENIDNRLATNSSQLSHSDIERGGNGMINIENLERLTINDNQPEKKGNLNS
jgi:hypothetical protein